MAFLATLSVLVLAPIVLPQSPQGSLLLDPGPANAVNDVRIVRNTTVLGTREIVPPGMVHIPAGDVTIGTPPDDVSKLGQNDQTNMTYIAAEIPRRQEHVDAFFIDLTEVTNLQWKAYLDATGRTPTETLVDFGWPGGKIPEGQEHYPITNVNYGEIRPFLVWAGKRLPTEVEWVRAARGDEAFAYPWGDRWRSSNCQSGMTVPQVPVAVGSHSDGASPFGVLDMTGNVFEWTSSAFVAFPDFESPTYKRGRKSVKLTPEWNSMNRVIKGGCFASTREISRIDFRIGQGTIDSDAGLGFRAARSAEPALDALHHAYIRLSPPDLATSGVDDGDTFGIEITDFDSTQQIITGYRHIAFAHRNRGRWPPLSKMKRDTIDEPFALGILTTSEHLTQPYLPPGEYTVAFKGKGESKAYKARRKEKRNAPTVAPPPKKKNGNGKNGEHEEPGEPAMVPWPGVPIHDIMEDLDFPQDKDVLIFLNASNAVVGWISAAGASDEDVSDLAVTESDDGLTWAIDFSIDITKRKGPRFTLALELAEPFGR